MAVDIYNFYSQFFELGDPNEHGDVQVLCPDEIHKNRMGRSQDEPALSINLETGLWKCFSCGAAGDIYQFYQEMYRCGFTEAKMHVDQQQQEPIPWEEVRKYQKILRNATSRVKFLQEKRGLTKETIERFHLGYDGERFIIPILDHTGNVVNLRRYDPNSKGSDKVKNKPGRGMMRLFPWENLIKNTILLVGGELDAIISTQLGFNGVSSTNGEMSWSASWDRLFSGKIVWICYDNDETGRKGSLKVAHRLVKVAKEVKILSLGVGQGEDITDYIVNYGASKDDLIKIAEDTMPFEPESMEEDEGDITVYNMHLSQASRAEYHGKNVRFHGIVAGKDLAPYMFPQEVRLACNMDVGDKCSLCALGMNGGSMTVTFKDNDPSILKMIAVPSTIQHNHIKKRAGISSKCSAVKMEIIKAGNVEEVVLIPELDFSAHEQEYVSRRSFYVGHGLHTNRAYEMYAVTIPHPQTQHATHLIYDAKPSQDNIEMFKMTPELYDKLSEAFQTNDIEEKFRDIHEDMTYNVTKIYGREDLITAMDLVYHSPLNFYFQGKFINRGWMECLIIGDPRSGKTETAQGMIRHYKLGEFVTGENVSFAGLIGGMQQNGKKWTITWGKIPLNDRRLIVLDEVSGLSEHIIGNMSGVRSSGVAEVTKIQTERTNARTRVIWMSNPRSARTLSTYSHGVQAIRELIGRPEDIARFDFAISSASDEVPPEVINSIHHKQVKHKYTSRLCKSLILWAWSRKPDQIKFTDEAVEAILKYAIEMGKTYTTEIPLVEVADQRIKLARGAIAVAHRTFSTKDGETVVVDRPHVDFAHKFFEQCYRKGSFAYYDFSQLQTRDSELIEKNRDEIIQFIRDNPDVADIFMRYNSVRLSDMEDMLGLDRDEARHMIRFLTRNQLVIKTRYGLVKKSQFIDIIRELRDEVMEKRANMKEEF